MKLSYEKIIQLSHRILAAIMAVDEIEFYEEPNEIRQAIVKLLNELLHEEDQIEETIRARIASQKRTIPEGGGEWEILYRKYYQDELRKRGIALPVPPQG